MSTFLDFYDDATGHVLKRHFETADDVPEFIKTAHVLSEEERAVLRDEGYALVLLNEGKVKRAFPVVDAGNTALSTLYFLAHRDRLPEEAQKVAAANLVDACQDFGLPVPPLLKVAAKKEEKPRNGMSRKRDPMDQEQYTGTDSEWNSRTNMQSVQGTQNSGGPAGADGSTLKTAAKKQTGKDNSYLGHANRGAEFGMMAGGAAGAAAGAGGAHLWNKAAPLAAESARQLGEHKAARFLRNAKISKGKAAVTGAVLVGAAGGLKGVYDGVKQRYINGPEKRSHVVDITGQKPTLLVKKASAQHYALDGRYPLDTFSDVEKAVDYFSENHNEFAPRDRHEYCVKVASRADELGLEVSELVRRYGSTEYAADVDAHLISRKELSKTAEAKAMYTGMLEAREDLEPEQFAELLENADRVSGLKWHYGGPVADAYFSTFGGWAAREKVAFYRWMSPTNEYVTGEQLTTLARNNRDILEKHFSLEIIDGFQKDPIAVFESMPLPQKVILGRLAAETQDSPLN